MAEDPNLHLMQNKYPALAKLVYTRGGAYTTEQLLRLQKFVERYFNTPPLESGVEAFVRMAPCDALSYFDGWRMLTAIPTSEPRELYRGQKATYIDVSNLGSIQFIAEDTFNNQTIMALRKAGRQLRTDRHDLRAEDHLRVFLLWENSD